MKEDKIDSNEVQNEGLILMKNTKPDIAFVCCVEAGPIEEQVLLLGESLRRWGGRLSKCPIYAVSPRWGLPLRADTIDVMKQLGIEYVKCPSNHDFTWYGYLNKATALAFMEEQLNCQQIVWLDSDTLIAGEPKGLYLSKEEDFAASPASIYHDIGASLEDRIHWRYWDSACKYLGLNFDQMPVIRSQNREASLMKMYWQGGVFAYRRSTLLGSFHKSYTLGKLKERIASRESGIYFHEQTSLAIAVWQLNMKYRLLDDSHNFSINPLRENEVDLNQIGNAKVIHYYGSLWPNFHGTFLNLVEEINPELAKLLVSKGPLKNRRGILSKMGMKMLKSFRAWRFKEFEKSCKVI